MRHRRRFVIGRLGFGMSGEHVEKFLGHRGLGPFICLLDFDRNWSTSFDMWEIGHVDPVSAIPIRFDGPCKRVVANRTGRHNLAARCEQCALSMGQAQDDVVIDSIRGISK